MKEFAGKTAVVTGAASGIGLALATRFAQARMQVVMADIEEAALTAAAEKLRSLQHEVSTVVVDTMLESSVNACAEQAIATYGNVHVLCNNAGVASPGESKPLWEISDRDWEWVMGVNLWGVLYGIRAFVPHMLEHGEASHIVNTASLAALLPGGSPYSVSKHGVLCLSEGLHSQFTAANANIGVSVLCPGFVDTRIHEAARNRPDGATEETDPLTHAMVSGMLQNGMPPADVAEKVFAAIESGATYILPHPAWDDIVRGRIDAVLARGAPMQVDMAALMQRRAAGEVI